MDNEEKNKIKSQFEHAQDIDSNNYICKFNSLWISFNCFYNVKFRKSNDISNIKAIKKDTIIKDLFVVLDETKKEDFYSFINSRGGIRNLKKQSNISYTSKESFGKWLDIIYVIRNNQFHGGKNWDRESDLDTLKKASIILEEFLQKLYVNHDII